MAEPFLGEIRMFAGTFAPLGFAECVGQSIPVAQNQALFSLVGIAYGGDGRNYFALPDLRGRAPIGVGQGKNLSEIWRLGDQGGREYHALTVKEMPQHDHQATFQSGSIEDIPVSGNVKIKCHDGTADKNSPKGNYPANVVSEAGGRGMPYPGYAGTSNAEMASNMGTFSTSISIGTIQGNVAVLDSGSSQPFGIMQPSLAITFGIATTGVYPSRPD